MRSSGADLIPSIVELWGRLSRRRRLQFFALIGLTLAASVLEIASLGMLFPFLAVLAAPAETIDHPALVYLSQLLGTTDSDHLMLAILAAFCGTALLSGAVRLTVLYANTKYAFAFGAQLGEEVYRRALYQPYVLHLSQNSSNLIDGVMNKTMAVTANVVAQLLLLITSVIIGLSILAALLWVDPVVALITGLSFGLAYVGIVLLVRGQLRRNSEIIAVESGRAIKALQEGLGGIRDVIIDNTQEMYAGIYRSADRPLKLAIARNNFIAGSPRFVVETLGMILIATLAYVLTQRGGGMADAVPTLGVLALGAQRLLPILQQSYAAMTVIRGNQASLVEVLILLKRPRGDDAHAGTRNVAFEREIRLAAVGYSYPTSDTPVVSHLDLVVEKGSRVGLFGATGGGKSTTLDIIMGLLQPTTGAIQIDGVTIDDTNRVGWRKHVAHVPQSIFLADSTIAENIALGSSESSEIDLERVRQAARLAQIDATIQNWPMGYDTMVGERGLRLSGGQRQRIGVARALYKQADLIILDEATSALDNETEAALMKSIESIGSGVTIIMVAHRLTTLKNCDVVVELEEGRVKRVGTYAELIGL